MLHSRTCQDEMNGRPLVVAIVLLAAACGGSVNEPTPVATLELTAPSVTLVPRQSVTLTATARDATGQLLTGRLITWSSSAAPVATVSQAGIVTAQAVGGARITATSEGKSSAIDIVVVQADACGQRPLPASCGLLGEITGNSSDNPHEVLITKAQLDAGDAVELVLGGAPHTHTLSLRGDQVRQIALGVRVEEFSSANPHHATGMVHNHLVRFN